MTEEQAERIIALLGQIRTVLVLILFLVMLPAIGFLAHFLR
jgi:hypothetical protein